MAQIRHVEDLASGAILRKHRDTGETTRTRGSSDTCFFFCLVKTNQVYTFDFLFLKFFLQADTFTFNIRQRRDQCARGNKLVLFQIGGDVRINDLHLHLHLLHPAGNRTDLFVLELVLQVFCCPLNISAWHHLT